MIMENDYEGMSRDIRMIRKKLYKNRGYIDLTTSTEVFEFYWELKWFEDYCLDQATLLASQTSNDKNVTYGFIR